ncbi:MAG TPA: hypothetical protein VG894_01340 [Bauldia sp.]|nr:hypothetical protein [Bauldia sp.]
MRFFFDTVVDGELVKDNVGTVLPDLAAARRKATEGMASMAKEAIVQGARTVQVIVRTDDDVVARTELRIS